MTRKLRVSLIVLSFVMAGIVIGLVLSANLNIETNVPAKEKVKSIEKVEEEKLPAETEPAKKQLENISEIFIEVANKVKPAVVNIQSELIIHTQGRKYYDPFFDDPFFKRFFGDELERFFFFQEPKEYIRTSGGSGVIIDEKGYIITNYHVVKKATRVKVFTADKREYVASIIGTDQFTDLALLKIDNNDKLPFATLGDSDKVEIGEWVIAIGSPLGFDFSVTAGIISAKGRSSIKLEEGPTLQNFLQTDAAINHGNSGGPLVNLQGEVIGINTAIASYSGGAEGIGFAIPSNIARNVIEQLKSTGKVERGWLGIGIQTINPKEAKALKMKEDYGVMVTKVWPDSPAEKADFKVYDVIVKYNDKKIETAEQLMEAVSTTKPDTIAKVKVFRDGKYIDLKVKVGLREIESGEEKKGEKEKDKLYGMKLEDATPEKLRNLGYKNVNIKGALVMEVEPGSIADDAGIIKGQIISEVNKVKVSNADECIKEIKKGNIKEGILLLVQVGDEGRRFVLLIE